MDTVKQQKLQASLKVREQFSMGAFIQFLLPVSILFSILSYYYSCYIHLPSINFFGSTFLHDLDHFINRKAMFLFCNAILLFITRESGLLGFFACTEEYRPTPSVVKKSIPCPVEDNAVVKSGGSFDRRNNFRDHFNQKRSSIIESTSCAVEEKAVVVKSRGSIHRTNNFGEEFGQRRHGQKMDIVEIKECVVEEEAAAVKSGGFFYWTNNCGDQFDQRRHDRRRTKMDIVQIKQCVIEEEAAARSGACFDLVPVGGGGEGEGMDSERVDEDIDELNKRFDEFIVQMKNQIRIGA